MKNILFVCEANLFRSYASERITNNISKYLIADSAGTNAMTELKASDYFLTALQELGYETPEHTAKPISPKLLEQQDLILCMEKPQISKILKVLPGIENKIHTLPSYVGFPDKQIIDIAYFFLSKGFSIFTGGFITDKNGENIPNPNEQQTINVYKDFIKEIETYVELVVEKII